MPRDLSLCQWFVKHISATDGPNRGQRLRLEAWQKQFLTAIDRERKPIVCLQAASQVGKSLLAIGVGLRASTGGDGVIIASSAETAVRDIGRRLDSVLDSAPSLKAQFPSPRSGPGARASWRDRRLRSGGWISLATAGSPSQLAARTCRIAIADEISRWPGKVRSGEGAPLTLLRARLSDWSDEGRLLAISSPVHPADAINLLFRDGDRRRMEYICGGCGCRTPFLWDLTVGRGVGEQPLIACQRCGALHAEQARRRMLRTGVWVPQKTPATDEGSISFQLSRLDSARASLGSIVQEFRRATRGAERGDPRALATFRNIVLGLPGESGGADVDKLYDGRGSFEQLALEQVTCGVDVQDDRIVFAVLGFDAANAHVQVINFGVVLGDPRDDAVWIDLADTLDTHRAPLPVSVVSVDAGFLTSVVKSQCSRRRWWIACVGRSGSARAIASTVGKSGLAVLGKDDAATWWAGRVDSGRVQLPATVSRRETAELLAAECLTAVGGALRWRPIEGRPNHLWDACLLAVHGRHFRTMTASARRPFRVVAV